METPEPTEKSPRRGTLVTVLALGVAVITGGVVVPVAATVPARETAGGAPSTTPTTTATTPPESAPSEGGSEMDDDRYVGMWETEDGRVRHELLPGGRYDEARGTVESAYTGRYWLEGDMIYYRDDTGFSADGEFIDGVLFHGGMVLHRTR